MPVGGWSAVRSVRFAGGDVYLALTSSGLIYGGRNPELTGAVVKISQDNGVIEWFSPVPYLLGHSPRLVLDTNDNQVLSLAGWGDRTQLRRLSMSDGTPLGNKFETCAVDQCLLFYAILATDGTIRMVHDTTDYYSGSEFELTTLPNIADLIFADGFGF